MELKCRKLYVLRAFMKEGKQLFGVEIHISESNTRRKRVKTLENVRFVIDMFIDQLDQLVKQAFQVIVLNVTTSYV